MTTTTMMAAFLRPTQTETVIRLFHHLRSFSRISLPRNVTNNLLHSFLAIDAFYPRWWIPSVPVALVANQLFALLNSLAARRRGKERRRVERTKGFSVVVGGVAAAAAAGGEKEAQLVAKDFF